MFKKILVPMDLDASSSIERQLEIAAIMADDECEITLLNVVEEIPSYVVAQLPRDVLNNRETTALDGLRKISEGHDIDTKNQVVTGHVASCILETANQQKSDLIVIGSHSRDLIDYLIGSSASRVVTHARCTVVVARS